MEDSNSDLPKIKRLIILFPFLYLLHDLEEIFTVEKFLKTHSTIIPFQITTEEFSFAFILLWLVASIGCFKAFVGKKFLGMKPTTYLSFLVPGILLANGIGHLLQFIYFKHYVPGFITSIIIIFPYCIFTGKFLITKKLLTLNRFLSYLLTGFVLQAPLTLIAHYLSKLTFHFLLNN